MTGDWPQPERRAPSLRSPFYAVRAPLARWLRDEAQRLHGRIGDYRLLDVGCGVKPYYPFFEPYASAYVGVDPVENPAAELKGSVEELPVEDGSFDVVLCTQVLEHVDDPAQAVRELRRVLAPGGVLLLSTHGVMVYHPSPQDLWRWTHAGLERVLGDNGEWASLAVTPASGTAACIGMLLAIYFDVLMQKGYRPLGLPVVAALNRAGEALDRRSARLSQPGAGAIFANYHVVAEAPR